MSTSAPTGQLERRYRRLLIAYPPAYRGERSEEMIDTLMSVTGDDRRWPLSGEAVALVIHGLRTRLRQSRRDLRAPLAADAAHHAALVTLALAASVAIALTVAISFLGHSAFHRGTEPNLPYSMPVRAGLGLILAALPAALAAAATGRARLARLLAVTGGVGAAASGAVLGAHALRTGAEHVNPSHLFAAVAMLCLPGVLLWFARGEVDGRRRDRDARRCLVLGIVLAVIFSLWVAAGNIYEATAGPLKGASGETPSLSDRGLNLFVAIVSGVVGAWSLASGLRRRNDPRRLAVAWAMSVPWLAAAVGTVFTPILFRPESVASSGRWAQLSTNLVQLGYTLSVVAAIGLVAMGSLQRRSRTS